MSRQVNMHCPKCGQFMSRKGKHKCVQLNGERVQVGFLRGLASRFTSSHVGAVGSVGGEVERGSSHNESTDYAVMYDVLRGKRESSLREVEREIEGQEILFDAKNFSVTGSPGVEVIEESVPIVEGEGEFDFGGRIVHGERPMFMTPNEIMEGWAPTEADRLYWYENGRGSDIYDETDEEFWDRKLREAKGLEERRLKFPSMRMDEDAPSEPPPAPSKEAPGFPSGEGSEYRDSNGEDSIHDSLYDALDAEGVNSPISLENVNKIGEVSDLPIVKEPQVLGGNHRIAAMKELNPDEPIPVLFFDSVQEAKNSLQEEY